MQCNKNTIKYQYIFNNIFNGAVSDPRSAGMYEGSLCGSADRSLRSVDPHGDRGEGGGFLPFVDLCPSRPRRVLSRPGGSRCRNRRCYHVHATRGDPPRGGHSIQILRNILVSLSRTKETRRPEQADCEQKDKERRRRPGDRRLAAVRHLHLNLGHLEDREQRMRVHLVMLIVDLVAEILHHRRALLL
jgi:hypothetical protein